MGSRSTYGSVRLLFFLDQISPMKPRQELEQLANDHLLRSLHPIAHTSKDLRIQRDGCELWNFASNDYLGLSTHPEISAAFIDGIKLYGTGSGASRLVTGPFGAHIYTYMCTLHLDHDASGHRTIFTTVYYCKACIVQYVIASKTLIQVYIIHVYMYMYTM